MFKKLKSSRIKLYYIILYNLYIYILKTSFIDELSIQPIILSQEYLQCNTLLSCFLLVFFLSVFHFQWISNECSRCLCRSRQIKCSWSCCCCAAPHWEFACRVPPAYLSFLRPPCCKQHAAGRKLCHSCNSCHFSSALSLAAPIALKVMSPVARHPNTTTTSRCMQHGLWAAASPVHCKHPISRSDDLAAAVTCCGSIYCKHCSRIKFSDSSIVVANCFIEIKLA